ncbi:MAG: SufB/SufD family protein [Tepidiformaceae bacterium]
MTTSATDTASTLEAWLETHASDAARIAGESAMPTTIQRPWKYLDISAVSLDGYAAVEPGLDIASPATISVVPFEDAAGADADAIRANLGTAVPAGRSKLTAIHYSALAGGVLVNVPANVEGDEPVQLTRSYSGANALATPHTLIVTGANSRITVIDDYRSSDDDIVALPAVEIVPGPGAIVRYFALHRWGKQTRVFAEQRTLANAQDSGIVSFQLAVGGSIVKSHIESSLVGRGSSSALFGLVLGNARQHVDFFTTQDHIGPDTRSDLMFKAALYDRSRSVYYGMTRVGIGAVNADANQENRNLLLSNKAKADSDPVLEILTSNIIRASHGATAGPVDEEQLFYLQARGLPHREAEALLVRGFLGEVLARIDAEAIRDELSRIVEAQLEATE